MMQRSMGPPKGLILRDCRTLEVQTKNNPRRKWRMSATKVQNTKKRLTKSEITETRHRKETTLWQKRMRTQRSHRI